MDLVRAPGVGGSGSLTTADRLVSVASSGVLKESRVQDGVTAGQVLTVASAGTYTVTVDGTGTVALKDQTQTISGSWTYTSRPTVVGNSVTPLALSGSLFELASNSPTLIVYEADQAADSRGWSVRSSGGVFAIAPITDAGSFSANYLQITRSGNSATTVVLPSGQTWATGVVHWAMSSDQDCGLSRTASNTLGVILGGATTQLHSDSGSTWTAYGGTITNGLRRANGTEAAPTKVLSGELLGRIQFGGYYDDGAGGAGFDGNQVWIDAIATADWNASNAIPAALRFYVPSAAGSGAVWGGQLNPGSVWTFGAESAPLTTFDTITTPSVQLIGTSGANSAALGLARFDATAGDCPVIQGAHSKGASLGTYTATAANDGLLVIYGLGVDTTATGFRRAASLIFAQDATGGASAVPGRVQIQTANASGTLTTAVTVNSSQQTLLVDGTVSLPPLSFVSDPDSGLYRIGANSLGLATGGALALSVNGSQQTLHADGTAAQPSISFASDPDNGLYFPGGNSLGFSAGGVERMRLIGSGGVFLIGHTATISIGGTTSPQVQNYGTGAGAGNTMARWSADITPVTLRFGKSRGATIGAVAALTANDLLGRIDYVGDDGTAMAAAGVRVDAYVSGTVATNIIPGSYRIQTMTTGGTLTSALILSETQQAQHADGTVSLPGVSFISDTNCGLYRIGTDNIALATNGTLALSVTATQSVTVGVASLATTATNGFIYVPACAGTPTGVPTAITGMVPIVVDDTNNKLYFYSGGAWRDAGP